MSASHAMTSLIVADTQGEAREGGGESDGTGEGDGGTMAHFKGPTPGGGSDGGEISHPASPYTSPHFVKFFRLTFRINLVRSWKLSV